MSSGTINTFSHGPLPFSKDDFNSSGLGGLPSRFFVLSCKQVLAHSVVRQIVQSVLQYGRLMLASLFIISIPFIINYGITWIVFNFPHRGGKANNRPRKIPYFIPYLGSALQFGTNPRKFIKSSSQRSPQEPYGVALPNGTMYFLQGAQNILELWRKSTTVPGTKVHLFFLKNLFGMPSKCIEVYAADNSGIKAQPLPGSDVPPNRRIHHLTHKSMLQFMGGMGLSGWYERWAKIFYGNLDGLKITEEWTEMPDLMAFFAEQFGSSVIESMCGPLLRQINPSFMQDLKTYHYDQPTRTKGFPEWMIPKAYAVRRGILQNIKEWHATARMHCNKFSKEADYDLSWGSEFMRDRQEIFEGIDEFDHDAYASSDLGLIWTANTNIVPSMMWMIYETFRDIKLLARVREEIASAFRKDDEIINMKFDSQTLEALPLIKSIYAETLRLRIHVYCVRYTGNQDLEINDWVIPKERVLLVATAPAHMDETFWNTKDGGYPLDTFWSDRFLVDPSDPQSGPVKPTHRQHVGAIDSKGKTTGEAGQVRFSLDGTEGQWIPYGGGTRSCPGRFYSKHVMVAACAMMASFFDVEILADETAGKMNPLFYGFGGQHPIEKIPFRIRKRATEERGGSSR